MARVAHRLWDLLGREPDGAWVPAMIVAARVATDLGDRSTAWAIAQQCWALGGEPAGLILPVWLDLLRGQPDRAASCALIADVPSHLRNAAVEATEASLLMEVDRSRAGRAWDRALSAGWRGYTPDFIAALPDLPLSEASCRLLVKSGSAKVKRAMAARSLTPAAELAALARGGIDEAIAVICNPSCPETLLNELADHEATSIRRAVAACPRCPEETLQRLATDGEEVVLRAIRDNPACSDALRVRVALLL